VKPLKVSASRIDASGHGLTGIYAIADLTNLNTLNLGDNNISIVIIKNCPNLKKVILSHNPNLNLVII
jgi:Leucine-rich repeat (LRR) protein